MRALLLAIGLLLCGSAHAAKEENSALINFANDYAGALKPAELNALESQLLDISHEGSYQIAVAIHPSMPPGAERDNATELADKLLVGSAVENRGLVIFVFMAEKVVRLEVGYGLEGLVPDAIAHRVAEKLATRIAQGQMAPALHDAIAELAPVLSTLKRVEQKSKSWEWLPDFVLATIDATRGVVFFIQNRHALPKQLASWWKSNDSDSRQTFVGFGILAALFLLACLRPVIGGTLIIALPAALIPRSAAYWIFFWGTDAQCGKMLKPGNTEAIDKVAGIIDALYYSFAAFLVAGMIMASFITMVGHPGGYGGAGAWAHW